MNYVVYILETFIFPPHLWCLIGKGTLSSGRVLWREGKKGKESKWRAPGRVVTVNTEFLQDQSFVEIHVNGD